MTSLNLTADEGCVDKMIEVFETQKTLLDSNTAKAQIANNIGAAYLSINKLEKAKEWIEIGLGLDKNVPELKINYDKILKEGKKA